MKKILLSVLVFIVINYVNVIYFSFSSEFIFPFFYTIDNGKTLCSISDEYLNPNSINVEYFGYGTLGSNIEVPDLNQGYSYSCFIRFKSKTEMKISQIVLKGVIINGEVYWVNRDLGLIESFHIRSQFSELLRDKFDCTFDVYGFPSVVFDDI